MDLKKLENLQYRDGKLSNSKFPGPMKGLSKAFKKLKNSEKLLPEDTRSLSNFIDGFITVTTNKQIVGEDVAMAVKEVNHHKHSNTCRKYGTTCRFDYPKPPSPHTIITQPSKDSKLMKKKTAQA